MSLTFFADHCVSNEMIHAVTAAGHRVLVLKEHIPTESPDARVIEVAQTLDAILVTLNGDFSDIVRYPPRQYGGIVSMELHNRPSLTPALVGRLLDYVRQNADRDHYRGKLLIVEVHRVRLRQ